MEILPELWVGFCWQVKIMANKECILLYNNIKNHPKGDKMKIMHKLGLMLLLMLLAAIYCYAEVESAVGSIEIEPNPMEKNAVIRVTFNQKVGAEIIIETQDGTLVKTLFSGDFNLGAYEYFWDRLDNDGEFVPEGEYYVTVNYDYRYTSTKKTIILK